MFTTAADAVYTIMNLAVCRYFGTQARWEEWIVFCRKTIHLFRYLLTTFILQSLYYVGRPRLTYVLKHINKGCNIILLKYVYTYY